MKKLNLFLWFVALVGLATSCSRDEAAGPQNEASNRVRIGTSIDQALQTRAASVTIPENHQLRYVLEVWDTKNPGSLVYRNEKTTKGAGAVGFDFILTEAGSYKALLWADFVPESETGTEVATPNTYTHYADHHYVTSSADGLKAVTLAKTGADYVINDDSRDAFSACITIEKGTGAFVENVELTRPFGQINVIEKDELLLAKVATMTLTYAVPDQFNVETSAAAGSLANVKPAVSTLPTATADRKANLFYDFIFASATGQTTLNEIVLEFASNDSHVTLPKYTIPANMPVVRNKRTNISGSILQANSSDVTLTVTVSDGWTEPDEDIKLPDVWDGTYPASHAQAKEWLGAESAGATDADGRNHVFTITAARQLAALHYLMANYISMADATSNTDYSYATYKLAADINLNNHPWTPIGHRRSNSLMTFMGIFDGQGHTIREMNITGGYNSCGFFASVNGVVKHLNVKGTVAPVFTNLNALVSCGGIAGEVSGVSNACIAFCSFEGTIAATFDKLITAGGIAGKVGQLSQSGQILSCYSVVTDMTLGGTGSHQKGGIAGKVSDDASVIKGCCWQDLTGITDAYGTKEGNPTVDGNGSFADAAEANAASVIDAMNNATPTGYDYKWQAGTNGSYPVLVPKAGN